MVWAKQSKGFTIVELLIVIVVIGILAAITIVAFNGVQQRAVAASLELTVAGASKKIAIYRAEYNKYPVVITDCPSPATANICFPIPADMSVGYQINNSTNPQEYSLLVSKNTVRVGVVSSGQVTDDTANLLPTGTTEMTGVNEYLRYQNMVQIIDSWGLRPYIVSFDIKSASVASKALTQVYLQNGSGSKYSFGASVPVTTSYVRQSVTVTPTTSSATEVDAYLSFYGTYGTGNIPTVKNVRVELAN